MKYQKYLGEGIFKYTSNKFFADTQKAFKKAMDEIENAGVIKPEINEIQRLLENLIDEAHQDGYDKGYSACEMDNEAVYR